MKNNRILTIDTLADGLVFGVSWSRSHPDKARLRDAFWLLLDGHPETHGGVRYSAVITRSRLKNLLIAARRLSDKIIYDGELWEN